MAPSYRTVFNKDDNRHYKEKYMVRLLCFATWVSYFTLKPLNQVVLVKEGNVRQLPLLSGFGAVHEQVSLENVYKRRHVPVEEEVANKRMETIRRKAHCTRHVLYIYKVAKMFGKMFFGKEVPIVILGDPLGQSKRPELPDLRLQMSPRRLGPYRKRFSRWRKLSCSTPPFAFALCEE